MCRSEKPHGRHRLKDTTDTCFFRRFNASQHHLRRHPNYTLLVDDILQAIASIGDLICVLFLWPLNCPKRRQPKDSTALFADDDYRHCNLMVTVQLEQRYNCCDLLQMISSLGDLMCVQAVWPQTLYRSRQANDGTTPFAGDDYRPFNLVVIVQLISRCNCCDLVQMITQIGDLMCANAINNQQTKLMVIQR